MAIRVVVVGLGARGQDWLREIQTNPAYELAACVDIDPAALKQACGKPSISSRQCFTELGEPLDLNRCDAVIVATSAASHVEPCETALNRGLAVMVEKPFTLCLREAVKLASLAEANGMRPALGFLGFLGPLLTERSFSRLASWSSQSWSKRALSLLAATKGHTPEELKKLYYRLTPTAVTHKLARPTMLPVYDWENTRAFSLPTDQYGWIRINLSGREAQGSVPLDRYADTCAQLEQLLLGLTNEDGQSLVQEVTRTSANAESVLSTPLPDLVVRWQDAAFAWPLRIKGSKVQVEPVGKKSTGQHASEGFCIYRGDDHWGSEGVVDAKDLGRLMTGSL